MDLGETVVGLTRMLQRLLPDAVKIDVQVPEDATVWIMADKTQIQQVIMNLAINARDAMPKGGCVTITVSSAEQQPDDRFEAGISYARLSVTDTGIGMAPETCSRVFEPFFSTKPRGRGTGMGLAVTDGIVRGHQGVIDVSSTPGEGSTFTIWLPSHAPKTVIVEHDTTPESPIKGHGTVLVVDDNEAIRQLVVDALEALDYRVLQAQDGPTLLSTWEAKKNEIDIIVLDSDMPRPSGPECIRKLRAAGVRIPAVLMTGAVGANTDLVEDAITTVVRKPFRMNQLCLLVADLLVPHQ
jgi:two-component system cell cycle sensor histidine kinase/response regulator CckA